MDIGSILLGIVVTAAISFPFALMIRGQRKRTRRILNHLSELANKHNAKLGLHEVCGELVIGFDDNQNKLFFLKIINEQHTEAIIDLQDVQHCKLVNNSKVLYREKGNVNLIDKISIAFTFKTKGKTEESLLIYDADESLQLTGELQLGEKWVSLINDRLKNKNG
jgi:hypothetical protein